MKEAILASILKEIDIQKDYFNTVSNKQIKDKAFENNGDENLSLNTIYFGGGTPTVFSVSELGQILESITSRFKISPNAEITVEANPDDLTPEYLSELHKLGINRLSIGIQSFFDDDLHWMNRRHNGAEAERAVKISQDAGFSNINVDLIYGLPQLTEERWIQNLEKFFALDVPHLSAYHLTIEPKTVFGYHKSKGLLTEIDEEKSVRHYEILIDRMKANNFLHYEISNFCKEGHYSKHNTNYWQYGHYLGIGPSAHSYNGMSRQWNLLSTEYIKAIENIAPFYEIEKLTTNDCFNDHLLTGLRTMWGVDKQELQNKFGQNYIDHLEKEMARFAGTNYFEIKDQKIRLTEEGMFVSDRVISELFCVT